jgi:hypothetical protein
MPAQATVLDKRHIVETVNFDDQARGDMVADGFEPLSPLVAEPSATLFLLGHPLDKVLIRLLTETDAP